ncbi:carbohydrate-binding module family 20 domain-containing protein [Jatrophihabitans lederbergiae]|uniref:Alpha-amylase n=1 Tax=Jatrophihabitans lederbergiae TaxID=3075547 RepID=A0ABU2J8W0_9ACTN|nr:carbohydrate-binding module family 20 domain-containing protein [Jatrophihabitans sp. DSM 44399]MDT0261178.1 carbohydrate-binding module family 20 domain-containing protein [Jatrophihabitans sp. DSM 44399]
MRLPAERVRRTLYATAASAALAATAFAGAFLAQPSSAAATVAPRGDVIANLFEWNWASVSAECTNVLGPDGYGAVQVAPPQESVTLPGNSPAHPWWEVYQPVSYQLNSRMGNRAAFTSMVSACHAAGVKVYADAVLNHMTGQGATGYAGTDFTNKYTYPGLYGSQDFHHYPADCPNSSGLVTDYNNQTDVQKCELVSLSDLRTESSYVRGKLAAYLNDLLSVGVDGFRLDAAKHINAADIAAIQSQLTRAAFVYQEVMPGGAVNPPAYEANGSVLEFSYGQQLKTRFQSTIAGLQTFGSSGLEPSAESVTFVDNHDTDRNGSTLSYKDGATYQLANVYSLARGYGTPQVYASFTFSNNDQSPPADGNGFVTATNCGNGAWSCQDRTLSTVGMVGWHNAVGTAAVANWWSDGSNVISFSRGTAGFVAINNSDSATTRTFAIGLAAGTYCDVIHGTASGTTCSGPTVTVDASHNASITVAAKDAVAFDIDSTVTGGGSQPPASTVAVSFHEYATTTYGQNVFVVGDIAALGGWDTSKAVALSSAGYPTWSGTVIVPAGTSFQYKYLKKNPDGSITWEGSSNRTASSGTGSTLSLSDTWR